jgi:hypothetical protein
MLENYANQASLVAYLGSDVPAPTVSALNFRLATLLVRKATRRARYRTTSTGNPAHPEVASAMSSAVCAQVLAWDKAGVDPSVGSAGIKGNVSSYSMGGLSRSYTVSAATDDSRAQLADGRTLSRLAYLELDEAGLIRGTVSASGRAPVQHVVDDDFNDPRNPGYTVIP